MFSVSLLRLWGVSEMQLKAAEDYLYFSTVITKTELELVFYIEDKDSILWFLHKPQNILV